MTDTTIKKNENLSVVRGDLTPTHYRRRLGRRPGPCVLTEAERELERDMRDGFVVLKTPEGMTPSRGIAGIVCADGATPWRALGRRIMEAIDAGCEREQVRAIAERFVAWVDRRIAARDARLDVSPLTSGEFPRPPHAKRIAA